MFSGIVETLGVITKIQNINEAKTLTISPQMSFDDLNLGDSIAVNGVCLTLINFQDNSFQVTVVQETLRVSTLNQLTEGSQVNLERSLKFNGRVGGHYVQGHVDAVGEILDWQKDSSGAIMARISIPKILSKYIINKGFITIDGMSITVIEALDDEFSVTFIPHTQQATITQHYQKGTWVNIEVDSIGKYIEKLVTIRQLS